MKIIHYIKFNIPIEWNFLTQSLEINSPLIVFFPIKTKLLILSFAIPEELSVFLLLIYGYLFT